jgi:hypothetical protein
VNENDVYKLIISNPKVEDTGKYTIEIAGIACTAYLDVEGKSFVILFASYLILTEEKNISLSTPLSFHLITNMISLCSIILLMPFILSQSMNSV